MFPKVMRELFSIKSVHTLNRTFLACNLVFAKITTRKIKRSKAIDIHDLLIAKLEA